MDKRAIIEHGILTLKPNPDFEEFSSVCGREMSFLFPKQNPCVRFINESYLIYQIAKILSTKLFGKDGTNRVRKYRSHIDVKSVDETLYTTQFTGTGKTHIIDSTNCFVEHVMMVMDMILPHSYDVEDLRDAITKALDLRNRMGDFPITEKTDLAYSIRQDIKRELNKILDDFLTRYLAPLFRDEKRFTCFNRDMFVLCDIKVVCRAAFADQVRNKFPRAIIVLTQRPHDLTCFVDIARNVEGTFESTVKSATKTYRSIVTSNDIEWGAVYTGLIKGIVFEVIRNYSTGKLNYLKERYDIDTKVISIFPSTQIELKINTGDIGGKKFEITVLCMRRNDTKGYDNIVTDLKLK